MVVTDTDQHYLQFRDIIQIICLSPVQRDRTVQISCKKEPATTSFMCKYKYAWNMPKSKRPASLNFVS